VPDAVFDQAQGAALPPRNGNGLIEQARGQHGDIAINGPDSDAELKFTASARGDLCGEVLTLPGNHDVGDEPPGQDPDQIINARRLARWDDAVGRDRFVRDLGGWRLLGVNAQLFGSGLEREAEQNRWLDAQLAAADLPVALFLHKPMFIDTPVEAVPSVVSMIPSARAPLLEKLRGGNVRLILSGHLHQHRDRTIDGLRHLWAPAVAFAGEGAFGGDSGCGVLVLDFSRDGVDVAVERLPGLISHDLAAIKGHGRYKFLRDMPPCPPPTAW
jgi:3',5'-cyclic AMP phosphodiesterase CpdA